MVHFKTRTMKWPCCLQSYKGGIAPGLATGRLPTRAGRRLVLELINVMCVNVWVFNQIHQLLRPAAFRLLQGFNELREKLYSREQLRTAAAARNAPIHLPTRMCRTVLRDLCVTAGVPSRGRRRTSSGTCLEGYSFCHRYLAFVSPF